MAPSDAKTRKLLGLLAEENSKTGKYSPRPSQFRETALDTHKSTPAHDFGPSPDLLPAGFRGSPDYLTMLKSQKEEKARTRRTASASRTARDLPPDQIEYKSVFKPRPEQEHVCNLAKQHRAKLATSEYALIDTLEVMLHNHERDQRTGIRAMSAAEQKAYLESQMREKKILEQQALEAAARDDEVMRRELALAEEAERRKLEAQRARNIAAKNERVEMLQSARKARHEAMTAKQAEEARVLAELQAVLDQEKAVAAAKAEEVRKASLVTKAENEARILARKDKLDQQKRLDAEMMAAGIRLSEKQEKEREDARKAFKAMIEARARGAGQKKVDDDREKAERDARLMKQFEQQREREAQLREQSEHDKRERQKAELMQARRDFLAFKEQKAAAARDEMQALKDEAEQRARADMEAEERKMASFKAKARQNGDFLATQIADKEQYQVDDLVGMSERERQLNHRLLKQAVKMVGPAPKQLTAIW